MVMAFVRKRRVQGGEDLHGDLAYARKKPLIVGRGIVIPSRDRSL